MDFELVKNITASGKNIESISIDGENSWSKDSELTITLPQDGGMSSFYITVTTDGVTTTYTSKGVIAIKPTSVIKIYGRGDKWEYGTIVTEVTTVYLDNIQVGQSTTSYEMQLLYTFSTDKSILITYQRARAINDGSAWGGYIDIFKETEFTYLCYTALENNTIFTISATANGDLYYSKDKKHWNKAPLVGNEPDTVTLYQIGDKMYVFGMDGKCDHSLRSGQINSPILSNNNHKISGKLSALFGTDYGKRVRRTEKLKLSGFFSNNKGLSDINGLDITMDKTATYGDKYSFQLFSYLFDGCSNLSQCFGEISVPSYIGPDIYSYMFRNCTSIVKPPAIISGSHSQTRLFKGMFEGCSNIKLSATQEGEYQTPYMIPNASGTDAVLDMFKDTGGTFKGTPTINTTYYGAW